jgi:2-oxo-3-hexenedioate decarboxylase
MSLCSSQTALFADAVLSAYRARRQIAPLSAMEPTFSVRDGEKVAHEVARRRVAAGERIVGRKIGFTNRTIWDEYKVYSPIWGPVYDTTFRDVAGPAEAAIDHLVEPRIEPEIILGFKAPVSADMDERAILGAVGWVAHGFEIVQSLFPGWVFQGSDCQAAFGLHGALFCGPRTPVEGNSDRWLEALATFAITIARNGETLDRGVAANVLDGPLSAVRHLAGVLAADPQAAPIAAGEIITTGTVTRAFPIASGEEWSTTVEGIDVQPMRLRLV